MATRTGEPPIVDLSDIKSFFNLIVYGDSGVGKTPFSASHPRSLILAADNGTISAARWGGRAKVWPLPDWEEFEKAQRWVRAGGYSRYDLIILDSFTMLREKCMRYTLETEHARNSARDEFVPAQPDHQRVQNVMKRTAERFCELPVSFLATALPMMAEKNDGEDRVMPMIHGQKGETSHYICGLFDCIGYLEATENTKGRKVHRIHWEPYKEYIGKDRFGVLAPYTDNATIVSVLDKLAEAGSPEARTAARSTGRTRTGTRRAASRVRRTA